MLDDLGWVFRSGELVAEPRDLAGSFVERLFPSQSDQGGGEDDFDEEAHGEVGGQKSEVSEERGEACCNEALRILDPRQASFPLSIFYRGLRG
jgi:hypothetical protein